MTSTGFQNDSILAELEDIKEEADLILRQLQTAQVQLEAEIYSHEATREENSLLLKQLHDTKSQLDSQTLSHQAAREENSLLLKELHQAQEELEKYYFYAQEQKLVLDRTTDKLSWNRDQLNHLTQQIQDHANLHKRTLELAGRSLLSSPQKDGIKLNQKSNTRQTR